ncbi:MAG: SUF system Fe-S cluster assembly regulator [Methylococcales symbiont of Hymedesmia sp. n. MRB-2018]|nr:MAG: SUF system Fe-S cluster assembly regulator [Methylococcales symbiont of Hymedesmia sp. n. MRB-2018]KAF3983593.1 MAG: SUF system Fe-S cluster assembly regulator [Methylococcales symbiont of Hymedesmia sp. n. MRB-2018]
MLKLSKLTDYATVILSYMAKDYLKMHAALEIAQATGITQPTVSKILKILLKANVLTSVRGAKGGYLLARAPENITVATVIDALEGPISLTECSVSHKNCGQVADCHVQGNWGIINQKILALLEAVTLADMILPIKPINEIRIPANSLFR